MKNRIGLMVSALMAILASTAGANSPGELDLSRLQGNWEVIARVCETSGNAASDRFLLGRDKMFLQVEHDRLSVFTVIAGEKSNVRTGRIYTLHRILVMTPVVPGPRNNRFETAELDVTPNSTLILTTKGFGQGGSCALGDSLKTYFRQNRL